MNVLIVVFISLLFKIKKLNCLKISNPFMVIFPSLASHNILIKKGFSVCQ